MLRSGPRVALFAPSAIFALLAALLLAAAVLPAGAASSTASSASDSASSAVGNSSDSIKSSSDGSSKATGVAAGEYRIVDVALLAGRPGMLQLKLAALDGRGGEGEFVLVLPQTVAERHGLQPGISVAAQQRPFGTAFLLADGGRAFFLVLADESMRDLPSRAVTL